MKHGLLFILLCAWVLWEQNLPQGSLSRSEWRIEYAFESLSGCERHLKSVVENWSKSTTSPGYKSERGPNWRTLWKLDTTGSKSELIETVNLKCLPDALNPRPGQ